MAQTVTLARPARNLRPYLWLALPLLVLATLFFYPLLLIAEQALRDASGNLSLETFWQVIDSKRFIGALLNTCLLYTSPSPRDVEESRMPSSA